MSSILWFGELLTCLTPFPTIWNLLIEFQSGNFDFQNARPECPKQMTTHVRPKVPTSVRQEVLPTFLRNRPTQFWKIPRNTSIITQGFQKRYFINQELWSICVATRTLKSSRDIPLRLWNRALINLTNKRDTWRNSSSRTRPQVMTSIGKLMINRRNND